MNKQDLQQIDNLIQKRLKNVATKEDVKELKISMKELRTDIKDDMKSLEDALVDLIMNHHVSREEFEELKAGVEQLKRN